MELNKMTDGYLIDYLIKQNVERALLLFAAGTGTLPEMMRSEYKQRVSECENEIARTIKEIDQR